MGSVEDRSPLWGHVPDNVGLALAQCLGVVTVLDGEEGAAEAFAAAGLTLTPILTLEDLK